MGTIKCCLLCLIIMSIVTATSGRLGFCPHGKHGVVSDRMQRTNYLIPIIGQSQELRCHFPYHLVAKSKLLWFKDINQVSITNTSDGRVAVSEGVVQVPENMSHSCSSRNTTFYTSVLSIRNFEKADYGRYECHVVPNDGSVTKMGKETSDFIDCSYSLPDPGKRFTINVQTVPSLTKNCKTHLTCEVVCADCCMCDTDSCRMLLVRDGKMLASTTSVASTVESDRHTFTSTFNVSINGLDDFGRYDCVLRQLIIDCVEGSMVEISWAGRSLDLRQPEEIVTMPQIAFMKSGATQLTCLFPEAYQKYLTQTGPTWKTWEVVLRKDGKEVASKESLPSPDNSVKESFPFSKCQDFYERYECVIRQVHHGCLKQAWFKEPLILSAKSHLQQVLNRRLVIASLGETTKHTCSFLVERREADRYAIVVTLYGNKVLQLDVDIRPSDDKEVDIVSANFEIEVKDPTSFGIYNCTLEKNGLPDPSAVKYDIHNMFQITPNVIFLPAHPDRTQVKLGTGLYLPCYYTDDVITAIDKVSQLSWYRNGVQIKDDDNHTTLIGQRFWVLEKLVSFLWCNVTVEDTEAFGTYECRYKDDKNDSSVTLQSFLIEPENWEEQAQELFNRVKKYFHHKRLYEEGIRVLDNALSEASSRYTDNIRVYDEAIRVRDNALKEASSRYTDNIRVYDEAIRVRDNALKGASYVLAELVVIVICMIPSFVGFLASWIRQKVLERGIRVTLANIQQMEALKGCGEGSHRYDVFISYSSADASWVRGDLLDNLEGNDYTVCLDTRDFLAGKPVLTNIATAIYQSRKVIVVMSKNFIKSGWCMHELVLTYQRKLDQKENCVIVMKYDDCKIPKEIALRTYLDWTEPMARDKFWGKLHEWLGPPSLPLLCIEDEKEVEVEEWFECQDSETHQQDGVDTADPQERDDVVIRQRQNIPSICCD